MGTIGLFLENIMYTNSTACSNSLEETEFLCSYVTSNIGSLNLSSCLPSLSAGDYQDITFKWATVPCFQILNLFATWLFSHSLGPTQYLTKCISRLYPGGKAAVAWSWPLISI